MIRTTHTRRAMLIYDGYSFTVYKPVPGDLTSLSQNYITAIYEDASGVALNNVAKHARASQAAVDLHSTVLQESGWLIAVKLCVRDNGRGFNQGDAPPNHLGLGIMRERAQAIGATLAKANQS